MKNPRQRCVRCQEIRDVSAYLGLDAHGKAIHRKTCALCLEFIRTPKKAKDFIHCRPDNPFWIAINKLWIPTMAMDPDDENP